MPYEAIHPTKRLLMQTVSDMLDSDKPYDLLVDNVLSVSGVSKGSLYHHFHDYPDLVEQTLLWRFSQGVDESIDMIRSVTESATNADEFWEGMNHLTLYSQSPSRSKFRAERARIIGLASGNDRFGPLLADEQERLTKTLAETISEVQGKGWVSSKIDPRALAVFIQSYTLGRAIDDISTNHVESAAWNDLIQLTSALFRG